MRVLVAKCVIFPLFLFPLISCNNRDPNQETSLSKGISEESTIIQTEDAVETGRVSIPSPKELLPDNTKTLVVSFKFRYNQAPPLNKRNLLISNFNSKVKPYTGWAIALTRYRTSLRFQVYIKDKEGIGAWYTLAPLEIGDTSNRIDTDYYLTFLISPGHFVSSAYSPVGMEDKDVTINGVNIEAMSSLDTEALLQITSGNPKQSSMRIDIDDLCIFNFITIPETLKSDISKGPRHLKNAYKNSCVFTLVDNMQGNYSCN